MTGERSVDGCAYCGLPTATAGGSSDGPVYCCFGCRFAAAVAAETGEEGRSRWTLTRLGLAIFFTMNVMVFTLALWSWDAGGDAMSAATAQTLRELFRYLAFVFAIPVLLLLGPPLAENAVGSVRRGVMTTDLLIVIGVAAAFIYSVVSVLSQGEHIYFEVGCMVLVAVTLGRWLEATGKLKATNALRSLEHLLPQSVRLSGRSVDEEVRLDEVRVGQQLRILPGERIAVDGVIRRGQAAIDERIVSGESEPSVMEVGDEVLAGTLNLDGDLIVEVTAAPKEGTLQRLINAVCEAASARGQMLTAGDRVVAWFTPTVVVIAVAVFATHCTMGGLGDAIMISLAVLLIACPCALGIALPLAVWTAMGQASRAGVVFCNSDAIARLARIKAFCFDKTGTLSTGEATVDRFVVDADTSRDEVLDKAWALASASTHLLSKAVRDFIGRAGR